MQIIDAGICKICKSIVQENDVFCGTCGKILKEKCMRCGAMVDADEVRCAKCGIKKSVYKADQQHLRVSSRKYGYISKVISNKVLADRTIKLIALILIILPLVIEDINNYFSLVGLFLVFLIRYSSAL